MDAIRLGPLVVPMQVALLLGSILLAQAVGGWFHKQRKRDASGIFWKMLLAGFGVARLVFVLRHLELYLAAPLSIIDVRDGGFDELAGFITAFAVGAELTRRAPALRTPLLVSTLAGCLVFFGGGALNQALAPAAAPLPDLEVRQLDGSNLPLRQFAGRPLVINLWATWCPPCRREMPALEAAQKAHPGTTFVFVNHAESARIVRHFLSVQGLNLQNVVIDAPGQLSARTGSSGFPTTLFYNAGGKLQMRHMGELSPATLADKLSRLNAASPAPPAPPPGHLQSRR